MARDDKGVAVLSPLRFNYETPDFRLPVRLGLLNSSGKQDLIVYVLSKGKRYEVANYTNTFVPTNLDVSDSTREAFGPFYATLFDATIAKAGGRAVVTEYSWASGSCDPCPTPPLEDSDVATLGGDVLFGLGSSSGDDKSGGGMGGGYYGGTSMQMVLTRLHTRYDATTLNEDLVFREADPVVGGREFMQTTGSKTELEKGARKDSSNNFQARYVIRHPWTGKIECDAPTRGIWGGPPTGSKPPPASATGLAAAPRGSVKLVGHVVSGLDDVASWDQAAGMKVDVPAPNGKTNDQPKTASGPLLPDAPKASKACNCALVGSDDAKTPWSLALLLAPLAAMIRRSRTRRRGHVT